MTPATLTDSDVLLAMVRYGGRFAAAIGAAWQCADDVNRAKLKAAFGDVWEKYRELAELKARSE
jgi:hypothetical protein